MEQNLINLLIIFELENYLFCLICHLHQMKMINVIPICLEIKFRKAFFSTSKANSGFNVNAK